MSRRKKEQRFNGNRPVRKSEYSDNRECYMDDQGNYVYRQWVDDGKGGWVLKTVCTIPVSDDGENAEWTILLDDMDCEVDRQENLIRKHRDPGFERRLSAYNNGETDFDGDSLHDPWDDVSFAANGGRDLLDIICPDEQEPEDPRLIHLRAILPKLTENQRNLILDHLGMGMQLEEIRRAEEAKTGKVITQQAMYNRWNKIIARLCKEFGVAKPRKKKASAD